MNKSQYVSGNCWPMAQNVSSNPSYWSHEGEPKALRTIPQCWWANTSFRYCASLEYISRYSLRCSRISKNIYVDNIVCRLTGICKSLQYSAYIPVKNTATVAEPAVSSATSKLTHWGWDKMNAISQTSLSNAFFVMAMLDFRLWFHWSLFLRAQFTIFQHWFR